MIAITAMLNTKANETGKGVNAALKTATHDEQSEVIPIKLRLDNGELRPITAIDKEVEAKKRQIKSEVTKLVPGFLESLIC